MSRIDRAYCLGYIEYMLGAYRTQRGDRPSANTVYNYCRILNTALNAAVREGIIAVNPFALLATSDKPRRPESHRCYLSIDELHRMIDTPMAHEAIRRAFVFACLCGLRISDIQRLCWANIVAHPDGTYIEIVVQKTQAPLCIPLSAAAMRWLPSRGAPEDRVFGLPSAQYTNRILKAWAQESQVSKHVSFHVARHTFATMMITLGADLYTTSKLLGHTDVRMTQIYAKIVNEKKRRAVELANGYF